jgi:hypothetical protein
VGGPRTRVALEADMNAQELLLQCLAPRRFVQPHQELRSDRLRDYLSLKILADDAAICK